MCLTMVYLQMLVMYPQSSWQTTYSCCLIHDCPLFLLLQTILIPDSCWVINVHPPFLPINPYKSTVLLHFLLVSLSICQFSLLQYTTSAVSWLELEMETDVWLASWPRSWKMVKPQALEPQQLLHVREKKQSCSLQIGPEQVRSYLLHKHIVSL